VWSLQLAVAMTHSIYSFSYFASQFALSVNSALEINL